MDLPLASEYRLVTDNISELALGRYGLVLTLALGISGLGVIGLSHAIRQLTAGCRGSFVGSLLIGFMAWAFWSSQSFRPIESTAGLMWCLNPRLAGSIA